MSLERAQQGERLFPRLVQDAAEHVGASVWFSDDGWTGAVSFWTGRRLMLYGDKMPFNPVTSSLLATDRRACAAVLGRERIPMVRPMQSVPPTCRESRYIVVDGQTILAYDNAGVQIDEARVAERELAIRAVRAVGCRIAAVDIVMLPGGKPLVLTMNDELVFEHFVRCAAANWEAAVQVYAHILRLNT